MKKSNYFIKTRWQGPSWTGPPDPTLDPCPDPTEGPGTLGPGPHTFFLAVWWTLPAYPGPPSSILYIF